MFFSYKYCFIGKACELIDRGDNTYGGKWVINPSGGLISKGHPLGATGMQTNISCSCASQMQDTAPEQADASHLCLSL